MAGPFGLEPGAGGGEAGAGHRGGVGDAGGEAGEAEGGAVGLRERRRADQHDVAAEPVGAGAGELGADQQAREPGAGALGREAVQQRLGAQREEARRRPVGAGEAVLDRLEEVGLGPAVGRERSCAAPTGPRAGRRSRRSCSSRSSRPRRRATCAHLVWVPGRQATPSKPGSAARRPAIWVSSPRMTSAGVSWRRPGRMRTARRGSAVGGRAKEAGVGAQGTVGVGRLGPGAAGAGHAADDDVGAAAGGARGRRPRAAPARRRRARASRRRRRDGGLGEGGAVGVRSPRRAGSTSPSRRRSSRRSCRVHHAAVDDRHLASRGARPGPPLSSPLPPPPPLLPPPPPEVVEASDARQMRAPRCRRNRPQAAPGVERGCGGRRRSAQPVVGRSRCPRGAGRAFVRLRGPPRARRRPRARPGRGPAAARSGRGNVAGDEDGAATGKAALVAPQVGLGHEQPRERAEQAAAGDMLARHHVAFTRSGASRCGDRGRRWRAAARRRVRPRRGRRRALSGSGYSVIVIPPDGLPHQPGPAPAVPLRRRAC